MLYIIFHDNRVYLEMARHLLTAGGVTQILTSCDAAGENVVDEAEGSGAPGMLIAAMSEDQYDRLADLRRMLEDRARKTSNSGLVCGVNRRQLGAWLTKTAGCAQGGAV